MANNLLMHVHICHSFLITLNLLTQQKIVCMSFHTNTTLNNMETDQVLGGSDLWKTQSSIILLFNFVCVILYFTIHEFGLNILVFKLIPKNYS